MPRLLCVILIKCLDPTCHRKISKPEIYPSDWFILKASLLQIYACVGPKQVRIKHFLTEPVHIQLLYIVLVHQGGPGT